MRRVFCPTLVVAITLVVARIASPSIPAASAADAPPPGGHFADAGDGNNYTLTLTEAVITDRVANEGGVFNVSNNRTGHLVIVDSSLARNDSLGFKTNGYPGVFYLGSGPPIVSGSSLT
ncbi:MAG: hypothetical protein ACI9C1_001183 [Candidatus Aldehydirespiratoraceae bacterium]|jgi:hypothetical protein